MARRVVSLILAQLNMNFAISHSRYYYLKKRQRLWEPVLIALGIASGAGMLAFGIYRAASYYYSAAEAVGQGAVTLTLGILIAQVIVLILGFVLVIAVFYFSNDLSILIPFPLRPAEVIASKFAVILANEYVSLAVFIVPVLVAYGVRAGVNVVPYVVSSMLVFLAIPIVPLVLAAVPAILLMRVVGLSRRKDTLAMIGGFLFVAVVVGLQLFVQLRAPGVGEEAEFLAKMLATADSLVDVVGARFPPSVWATKALALSGTWQGLSNLAVSLAAGALGFVVLLAIGERVFYQGVLSGFEAGATRAARRAAKKHAVTYAPRSPVVSLAIGEIKLFTRTPVFVLNGFTGFVMFPVMFVLMFLARSSPEIASLWDALLATPGADAIGALVIAGYFFVLAAMSAIPFTAFSREGSKNIWISRSFPVAGRTVALGKAVGAEGMIAVGALPGVAVLWYLTRLPLSSVLAGVGLGLLSSFVLCVCGVLFDMWRPMLNWTDQQKAIKSNLNVLVGMLIGAVVIVLMCVTASFCVRLGLPEWAVVAGVAGAIATLLIVAVKILGVVADELWVKLEA
ncbi:MAG: putative ABC transporter permease subunit [Betaproteobacteria bacterium]